MGAFAGPRATANILTRATMTCFALFVGLSLLLAILAGGHSKTSVLDQLNQTPAAAQGPVIAPPVDEGDTIGEPSRTIEKPIVPVDQ
jgi:preprotein translocase subunit SecG